MASERLLKRDMLGAIVLNGEPGNRHIVRDCDAAAPGLRWLARRLCAREARALQHLAGLDGVPQLLGVDRGRLRRSWLDGDPLHRGQPPTAAYFRSARRLLRAIHRRGMTHNDLAKEANWIGWPDGRCGIVDFQIATRHRRRTRQFRLLAREDLRHLLKHKRTYLPAALTARERAILNRPSLPARAWRRCVKPIYHWVTRAVLGWPERHDAEERGSLPQTEERRSTPPTDRSAATGRRQEYHSGRH